MENTQLWHKICTFQLDDSNAEITFSDKLQTEEKWTDSFTFRAISEYKKFLYLCVTQPNGASPAEIVDKVWHLHLTYTNNYWHEFCKKVIEKELHHYPNKGGQNENQKHNNWYNETLIAYTKEFGEIPPDDIWAVPSNLNLQPYLPKNSPYLAPIYDEIVGPFEIQSLKKWLIACGASFIGLILFCGGNPYNLSGKGFLWFYFFLMLIGFLLVFINKEWKKITIAKLSTQLHPLHFSTVFRDVETTLRMLIVNFVEKKYLKYEQGTFTPILDKSKPLFYSIQAGEKLTISARNIREICLQQAQYFSSLTQSIKTSYAQNRNYLLLFHFIIFSIGIIRLIQGKINNFPVGYLIGLMLLYVILYFIFRIFNFGDIPDLKKSFENNSQTNELSLGAVAYMFSGIYLFDSIHGMEQVFDPFVPQRVASDGSGCSSSGGDDGGGGCSSCGGGCGGGGD